MLTDDDDYGAENGNYYVVDKWIKYSMMAWIREVMQNSQIMMIIPTYHGGVGNGTIIIDLHHGDGKHGRANKQRSRLQRNDVDAQHASKNVGWMCSLIRAKKNREIMNNFITYHPRSRWLTGDNDNLALHPLYTNT